MYPLQDKWTQQTSVGSQSKQPMNFKYSHTAELSRMSDVISYACTFIKKEIVISTSHLLSEFQVSERIICMDR